MHGDDVILGKVSIVAYLVAYVSILNTLPPWLLPCAQEQICAAW